MENELKRRREEKRVEKSKKGEADWLKPMRKKRGVKRENESCQKGGNV